MRRLKIVGVALTGALLIAGGCGDGSGALSNLQNINVEKSDEPSTEEPTEPVTTGAPKEGETKPEGPPEDPAGGEKGTREDPLAIGEMSTAIPDWEVTVVDVNLDATAELVDDPDLFNDPPQTEGGVYVTVSLETTFLGQNASEGNPGFDLTAVIVGNDAKQYVETDNMATTADAMIAAPTIEAGGQFAGSFVVDIPADALDGAHLFLSSLMGDEEVYWQLPSS